MSTPNESVENSRLLRYGRQPKMQTDIHTNGAHPVCSGGFSPVVDLLFRCERPQARHQRIMGLLLMALQCDEVHQSGIKQVLALFLVRGQTPARVTLLVIWMTEKREDPPLPSEWISHFDKARIGNFCHSTLPALFLVQRHPQTVKER